MRLLCIQDQSLDSGKAGVVQISHMCSAFMGFGVEVTLAIPDSHKESAENKYAFATILGYEPSFRITTYTKRRHFGRFSMLGGYFGACDVLSKTNADICYLRNALLVRPAIHRGLGVIYEAHNSTLHDNRLLDSILSKRLINDSQNGNLLAFVSISDALSRHWQLKGVPQKKCLALHDAVEIDDFKIVPQINELRKIMNLPLKKKIVVYTGSLYLDREIGNIIRLAQSHPQALFLVVGGPDEAAIYFRSRATGQGANNIVFTGKVAHSKVKDYLFAADVLLMVWSSKVRTINYCSPLKVFEYMAAGKTIVGHGFPTIREVLTDGQNALLCDPESFSELNSKLTVALEMPLDNELAKRARQLAFDKYSWKIRAGRILATVKTPCEIGEKEPCIF